MAFNDCHDMELGMYLQPISYQKVMKLVKRLETSATTDLSMLGDKARQAFNLFFEATLTALGGFSLCENNFIVSKRTSRVFVLLIHRDKKKLIEKIKFSKSESGKYIVMFRIFYAYDGTRRHCIYTPEEAPTARRLLRIHENVRPYCKNLEITSGIFNDFLITQDERLRGLKSRERPDREMALFGRQLYTYHIFNKAPIEYLQDYPRTRDEVLLSLMDNALVYSEAEVMDGHIERPRLLYYKDNPMEIASDTYLPIFDDDNKNVSVMRNKELEIVSIYFDDIRHLDECEKTELINRFVGSKRNPPPDFGQNDITLLSFEEEIEAEKAYQDYISCLEGFTKKDTERMRHPKKMRINGISFDRYGRYFFKRNEEVWCLSMNHRDIFTARENTENTCFALSTCSGEPYHMCKLLGMFCSDPYIGVLFRYAGVERFKKYKTEFSKIRMREEQFIYTDGIGISSPHFLDRNIGGIELPRAELIDDMKFVGHDLPGATHDLQKRKKYRSFLKDCDDVY